MAQHVDPFLGRSADEDSVCERLVAACKGPGRFSLKPTGISPRTPDGCHEVPGDCVAVFRDPEKLKRISGS